MSNPPAPAIGHMVLYDRMIVPLNDGEYTMTVSADVASPGGTLPTATRYFNIEGPRYTLAPTEVSGVFPPRNGKGEFTGAMAQVVLGRRTLPWERSVEFVGATESSITPTPWLALLLIDETSTPEATVLRGVKVTDVLPAAVAAAISPPADATCDAIEIEQSLLAQLMPMRDELRVLSHVRQVNVEDRELSADDSDGWFAVVMSNRVPVDGRKYRACLVSVEGRGDAIPDSADVDSPVIGPFPGGHGNPGPIHPETTAGSTSMPIGTPAAAGPVEVIVAPGTRFLPEPILLIQTVRLILLHSWTFECEGQGTFQQLAEHLDVGMIGEVRGDFPKVADTGHLPLGLRDRAGSAQTVWYRGPLVPAPVTRDTRGPYHSADQARRVSPETGMEDVSYAAAFETGRLLAAADARFAQELMRWRRSDFRDSVFESMHAALAVKFPSLAASTPVESITAQLVQQYIDPRVKFVDPLELNTIAAAPGLSATRVSEAWNISEEKARAVLDTDLSALAPAVDMPVTPSAATTLDAVAADAGALSRLSTARGNVVGGT